MKYNVTILGGTNGFGKWLAGYIINTFGEYTNVIITGRDKEKGKVIASELNCTFSDDNIESTKSADIVIVSVPISITLKTIEQIAPFVKSGAILADVTSVKKLPSEYMERFSKSGVIVIPTHPMFGPYISTIAGQVFVLTPKDEFKSNEAYIFLKKHLEDSNAKVIETSADKHDEMMSVVQGLTHFTLFTMGKTMENLGFDIEFSQHFISPIYKILTASVGRYVSQDPGLYADIQMSNPLIEDVHDEFMLVAKQFNKTVLKSDRQGFIDMVHETHQYFGNWAEEGQKYTDKLIYLNSKQIKAISESIGKTVTLENIYTKEKAQLIIKSLQNEKIICTNGEIYDTNVWILIE